MITESPSNHDHLETWTVRQLLEGINAEDRRVPEAVAAAIPALEALVEALVPRMEQGGRLFYIGAGTSGRLGIVDASECPPTYGVPHGMVVGIIAGGDGAIRKAVEFAEDDPEQAWIDLSEYAVEADPSALLLDRARVALNAGPTFGAGGDGHVRLNMATSPAILAEIIARVADALPARHE